MTQLETPAPTPKQKMAALVRKRTRAPSVEDADEITAVDERTVDDNEDEEVSEDSEDSEDSEGESEEEAAQPTWKRNAKFLSRYLLRRDDTTHAQTHGSFVGGRYHIPSDKMEEFHRQYLQEFRIADSPSLFLLERYTIEPFRFFVDIDYNFNEDVPAHTTVISRLRKALARRWDIWRPDSIRFKPTLDLFPCRAACRTQWKLHVLFYNLIVDWQSAIRIGQLLQTTVNESDEPPVTLDMKVYKKGSLRMVGSYKRFDTTPEHVNETEFVYTPMDVDTGELLEWTDRTLEEYSIFPSHTQRMFIEKADLDGVFVADDDSLILTTSKDGPIRDNEPMQYTGTGSVVSNGPLYNCIKEHFGDVLASAAGKIIHNSETNCSAIDCSRTTYCPLAKRFHSSNHAYIVLSEFGMRVKCYSTTHEACRKGGQLIPRKSLPEDVLSELPQKRQANLDISTIEGQARLLHQEFFDDGLRIFKDDDLHYLFILSFSGTDHDVAELVSCTMGDHFVCVDVEKQQWYHYRQPLWRFKEAKNEVYNQVTSVLKGYDHAIQWYYKTFSGKEEIRAMRIRTILNVKKKICDITFKNKVMKTLAHTYLDVRFEVSLDQNRTLIGFNDGVYDIAARAFREGKPSDHISMTVGYNFPKSSNPTYRQKLDELLQNMQPEIENLQYLKKHLGSSLAEGNSDELFHIWSGTTRNGKSLLALLLTVTLGSDGYKKEDGEICRYPYACPYEADFLTGEKKSGPSPETIISRLARILIGTEPDAGVKIKSNFMKKLTGNDLLIARLLFSNEMVTFTPMFQLILLCNKIPVMDQNDPAVWKRSRVIDFPITFVDNPQTPNERLIDRTLKSKLVNDMGWRKEFMLMLLEWYYELFLADGMNNPPASVLSATSDYQEQSIPIANFWNTCIARADTHMCLECILEQCRDRAQENKDKSFDNYKVKDVQTELEGLGVIIRKQVRCGAIIREHVPYSRCGGRRRGVSNVGLSEEMMAEIAEKERLEVERMREIANQM